ncbi:MAG: nitroreductase [Alphaproteobacteria bacterium CG_4_10_14_0_2_um_filter_63_37]|nr:MAG: hypothetical protein AUJ55_10005 [Proteobacteria bacterium CG1_02_64_396]PJA25374.1 MAG: nitroreductase [Alphaproteobacteria bacterium CG_4_10_14_0_2_um_filter_63_37]
MPPQDTPLETIRAYHNRTKHRLDRYAAGPGYLDWDTQPDPFRRFAGCPLLPLPLSVAAGDATLTAPASNPAPLNHASVAQLLELSLGLSAWKAAGPERWALRCNPSSGNLHPTEGYVASWGVVGIPDGVHHYRADQHALEQRCAWDSQGHPPALLLGLSSIAQREAWKYGERAFRYVQLDVGHALGAVGYAAATLGWQVHICPAGDNTIAALLGLDRNADFANAEQEWPDLLVAVGPDPEPYWQRASWGDLAKAGRWQGQANRLSDLPRNAWPVIGEVAQACHSDAPAVTETAAKMPSPPPDPPSPLLAPLIRQRRSAQAFDPSYSLAKKRFFALLRATLPEAGLPWSLWPLPPRLDLILFVHRVEGLEPGLYLFSRGGGLEKRVREDWNPAPIEAAPEGLPLMRLTGSDARKAARMLSCHQEIASSSAFSLGMLAPFDAVLHQDGPAAYRTLYWEAGLIGQALYLHAEAHGVRGTGIGCFFDDPVHELLGLRDDRFQSLYHFTVGAPKYDPRLQTFPPYTHLEGERTEALLAGIKGRIAVVFAEREKLKGVLDRGETSPHQGLAQLERIDRELSDLDSRYKAMWDALQPGGGGG